MNENEFHARADEFLEYLEECLETADEKGDLDVECQSGVMTIALCNGKQFIVSKHVPTKQLWLSSPVSGGLHFSYVNGWVLADGSTLNGVLLQELKNLANVRLEF